MACLWSILMHYATYHRVVADICYSLSLIIPERKRLSFSLEIIFWVFRFM
uniref:Ankyrin repeat-containing protein At5g02620 n=1 Tax=Rhizophora mucronata TaxID=61149 RepID=A0A2P2KE83_RHIMU